MGSFLGCLDMTLEDEREFDSIDTIPAVRFPSPSIKKPEKVPFGPERKYIEVFSAETQMGLLEEPTEDRPSMMSVDTMTEWTRRNDNATGSGEENKRGSGCEYRGHESKSSEVFNVGTQTNLLEEPREKRPLMISVGTAIEWTLTNDDTTGSGEENKRGSGSKSKSYEVFNVQTKTNVLEEAREQRRSMIIVNKAIEWTAPDEDTTGSAGENKIGSVSENNAPESKYFDSNSTSSGNVSHCVFDCHYCEKVGIFPRPPFRPPTRNPTGRRANSGDCYTRPSLKQERKGIIFGRTAGQRHTCAKPRSGKIGSRWLRDTCTTVKTTRGRVPDCYCCENPVE